MDRKHNIGIIPRGSQIAQYANKSEIPEGAVRLSDDEVLQLHFKNLMKWKPVTEM